jgi:hypothetical protein
MIYPSGRAGRRGSAAALCWDCWFATGRGHRCLSLVTFVYSQVGPPVQRSPTVCDVPECDRESSIREVLAAKMGRSNTGNKKVIKSLTRNVSGSKV